MTLFNSYLFQLAVIATLMYAIGDFLDIPLKHYILFAFLTTFNPTIGSSIQAGSKRILGIIAGGFIAFIVMIAFQQSALSVGIAIFLAILFCYFLNMPQAISSALVSVTMVCIGHYSDGLNQYYWQRFAYNSMGVILAGIAMWLMPPPSSFLQLEKGIEKLLISLNSLYQKIVNVNLNVNSEIDVTEIEKLSTIITKQIANNEKLLSSAKLELSQGFNPMNELEATEKAYEIMKQIAFILKEMSEEKITNNQQSHLFQNLYLEIYYLTQATSETLEVLSNISSQKSINENNLLLPDLTLILNTLAEKINNLRETGETYNYSLDEIIKISVFLDNLKDVTNQVNSLSQLILSGDK